MEFQQVMLWAERDEGNFYQNEKKGCQSFDSFGRQTVMRKINKSAVEFFLKGRGTLFQRKVWRAIQKIPYGETRSYQWIAKQIKNPRAVRAVGRACGKNPLPLLIPCHRVVGSKGKIGGFTGGLKLKRQLLKLESR